MHNWHRLVRWRKPMATKAANMYELAHSHDYDVKSRPSSVALSTTRLPPQMNTWKPISKKGW